MKWLRSKSGMYLLALVAFVAIIKLLGPRPVVVHLVTSDWGRMHQSLRSYRFVVPEGARFGPASPEPFMMRDRPFYLSRIINRDLVVVEIEDFLCAGGPIGKPPDSSWVTVGTEYVRLVTRSLDGGTTYYLQIDTSVATSAWQSLWSSSKGEETTETERPDTSFLRPCERVDEQTGTRTEWTERQDTSNSRFVAHGRRTLYDSAGVRLEETEYVLGQCSGPYRRWYSHGQMELSGSFANWKRDGKFEFWYENGTLAGEAHFNQGNATLTLKYENGQRRLQGDYCDDSPCGLWREWHPNGQLAREEDMDGGRQRIVPPPGLPRPAWFAFPEMGRPRGQEGPLCPVGTRAWFDNGQAQMKIVYDSALIDKPLDLEALLVPYDPELVKELQAAESVTGGTLWYPCSTSRTIGGKVERHWHQNGQISFETCWYDDGSSRATEWFPDGRLSKVADSRPNLGQRVTVVWVFPDQLSRVRISNSDCQTDFSGYFIAYLNGVRHSSELSGQVGRSQVVTFFREDGRPRWVQEIRDGKEVRDEAL